MVMMLLPTCVALVLVCCSVVGAQSSTTESAPKATHTMSVGADGLNFSPREIANVSVGEIIEFRFYPQNHSVARAAFGETPCIPYEYTAAGRVGFWSGFEPTQLVTNNPPIFRLPINDTEPVFIYCSAPSACFEGMIAVINPNSTFTFAAQFLYTQATSLEFSPLEYFPVEAKPSRTTTATGAATSSPSSSSSISSSSPTTTAVLQSGTSSHSSSLGTGPIVGIAIGGFAILVLLCALLYMCGRQKTVTEILAHRQIQSMQPSNNHNHNSYMPSEQGGMSEANYPVKTPATVSEIGRFSGYGNGGAYENESYRSVSPPMDERAGFMGTQQQQQRGLGLGVATPPGTLGYPSPEYVSHEMDDAHTSTGMSPYQPAHPPHPASPVVDEGPHEMGVPSRNPSAATAAPPSARPFSYSDSEADFSAESRNGAESRGGRSVDVKSERDSL